MLSLDELSLPPVTVPPLEEREHGIDRLAALERRGGTRPSETLDARQPLEDLSSKRYKVEIGQEDEDLPRPGAVPPTGLQLAEYVVEEYPVVKQLPLPLAEALDDRAGILALPRRLGPLTDPELPAVGGGGPLSP
ncbi:uncharacterized protein N7487_010681 [Penicillium crustosum]|uniref:uncharacterized protein n=1 Tax=Penicillium crustosum TaxID=36656 RepID=UPI0023928B9B|nr:uncharacterized protein N7487_010681 [Penicillium crustosum]KAJ5396378.1 hypothetical protein N7487_010681 [Penicillium crustosum]